MEKEKMNQILEDLEDCIRTLEVYADAATLTMTVCDKDTGCETLIDNGNAARNTLNNLKVVNREKISSQH